MRCKLFFLGRQKKWPTYIRVLPPFSADFCAIPKLHPHLFRMHNISLRPAAYAFKKMPNFRTRR